jgi:hypothetical protein
MPSKSKRMQEDGEDYPRSGLFLGRRTAWVILAIRRRKAFFCSRRRPSPFFRTLAKDRAHQDTADERRKGRDGRLSGIKPLRSKRREPLSLCLLSSCKTIGASHHNRQAFLPLLEFRIVGEGGARILGEGGGRRLHGVGVCRLVSPWGWRSKSILEPVFTDAGVH